jgi:hypothetical protein
MLTEPLAGDATEDNLGLVVPCPLSPQGAAATAAASRHMVKWQAADHGNAQGDGFGVVG